jgi:putative flippase GtrA
MNSAPTKAVILTRRVRISVVCFQSRLIRWYKFNLVGAIGMIVQLAALATLNRLVPGHYLYATAAALELTLLHNFVWHLHYTWRDRCGGSALAQLIRFHLSNGLVSLCGNLVLMRLLVHSAHLPILAANPIAILCCSLFNFSLSRTWLFRQVGSPQRCHPERAQRVEEPVLSLSKEPAVP